MIEFDINQPLSQDFIAGIPSQRAAVQNHMQLGNIISYTLNENRSKLWAVVRAENKVQAIKLIGGLPLAKYMDDKIHELTFHHMSQVNLPAFSLN